MTPQGWAGAGCRPGLGAGEIGMGLGGGLEMGVGMGEGVTGCGCTGAAWTAGRCSITGCCWKPACYVHSIPVSYLQQIWLARYHDPKYGHPYPCTQQRLDHVWRHGIDAVQVLLKASDGTAQTQCNRHLRMPEATCGLVTCPVANSTQSKGRQEESAVSALHDSKTACKHHGCSHSQ